MNEMNKDIDAIFDLLDKLISNNEMKYSAYSALHDQISFLADSLKEQHEIVKCKDCKWYKEGYDIDGKWFTRCNGDVRVYGHTKPD